jgi:hypothetical protein
MRAKIVSWNISTFLMLSTTALIFSSANAQSRETTKQPLQPACEATVVTTVKWVATPNPHVKQAPATHPVVEQHTVAQRCKAGG